jgi:hydrogenase maturation protease
MSSGPRVLVAGIGNVFLGDDGFGVEVVRHLSKRVLPDGVRVTDYGIRGFDLAFTLLEEWDTVIIVDATSQGGGPGSLYVIEADVEAEAAAAQPDHDQGGFQGHLMTPAAVFALVRSFGGKPGRVLIVGCEPESLGPENEGRMGLSDIVSGVVPAAVERVEHLVKEALTTVAASSAQGDTRCMS